MGPNFSAVIERTDFVINMNWLARAVFRLKVFSVNQFIDCIENMSGYEMNVVFLSERKGFPFCRNCLWKKLSTNRCISVLDECVYVAMSLMEKHPNVDWAPIFMQM